LVPAGKINVFRYIASSLPLIVLLPAFGCIAESGDPAPGSSHDLADRLRDPLALAIVPSEGGSFARVSAVTLKDDEVSDVELTVTDGTLVLALDDAGIRIDSLEVAAADVTIGPGVMPPDGAVMTGISFGLNAPLQAELASLTDTAALTDGGLPVELRWSVELDYGTVDLAPIRLPELPFELSVEMDAAGEVEAHLTARQEGAFWAWAGIFELRDLEVDLVAGTGPGAVD
jgi:hypothetical protein